MYKVKSITILEIAGRNTVIDIENPRECNNFNWLINNEIEIDGNIYIVKGVECLNVAKHLIGERIGLLVKEKDMEEIWGV